MFEDLLRNLGILETNSGVSCGDDKGATGHSTIHSTNPATGEALPGVRTASPADYERVVERARAAFPLWRMLPAPRRGEVVRQLGQALRARKDELGLLVTLETGKISSEGEGEVQEMIDMCDFAVGLSRQLYGLTISSERPRHRMIEQWQPLGPIGIITAFNFPVAVWAWNAAIAAVCGDTMIWKPSPLAPLCSIAVQKIVEEVARANDCEGVFNLCFGGATDIGETMIADERLPLVSATGSCRMGRRVGEVVGRRLGRAILELRWQQRHHHHPQRRSRARHPGDSFRSRRHRRPALHVGAPIDCARVDSRSGRRAPGGCLSAPSDRRSMGRRGVDGPADQRWSRHEHDGRGRCRP